MPSSTFTNYIYDENSVNGMGFKYGLGAFAHSVH